METSVQPIEGEDQQQTMLKAPDEVIRRFISSYGVRSMLMEFFDARVFAQFQSLSREFYDKRVAEV